MPAVPEEKPRHRETEPRRPHGGCGRVLPPALHSVRDPDLTDRVWQLLPWWRRGPCSGQPWATVTDEGVWLPQLSRNAVPSADKPWAQVNSALAAGNTVPTWGTVPTGSPVPPSQKSIGLREDLRQRKKLQTGTMDLKSTAAFSRTGSVPPLKRDTQPELGHIMPLCLGRAGAGALGRLSEGDGYGN